jgi:hypothetical protein
MSESYHDRLCEQMDEMIDVMSKPMTQAEIIASIRCYPGDKRFARASEITISAALHHLHRVARVWAICAHGKPTLWVSRAALKYLRDCRDYEAYQRKHGGL